MTRPLATHSVHNRQKAFFPVLNKIALQRQNADYTQNSVRKGRTSLHSFLNSGTCASNALLARLFAYFIIITNMFITDANTAPTHTAPHLPHTHTHTFDLVRCGQIICAMLESNKVPSVYCAWCGCAWWTKCRVCHVLWACEGERRRRDILVRGRRWYTKYMKCKTECSRAKRRNDDVGHYMNHPEWWICGVLQVFVGVIYTHVNCLYIALTNGFWRKWPTS